jgi:Bacterial aa3 type cytochrome c oxidase subunit IV
VTGAGESGKGRKTRQEGTEDMAEHKHGSMDIRGHEKTFAGFIKFTIWGAAISIGVLIFMALANA